MMARDPHIQQIAEEQGLGSIVRGYVPPSFGLAIALMGAGMIFFIIIFASQGLIGQWWLCLGFVEAFFLLLILFAFLKRKWAVYEYAEGFIVLEGRDLIVVHWNDIVSLRRESMRRNARSMSGGDTTYHIRLKQGREIMLNSSSYQEISLLMAKIDSRLKVPEQGNAAQGEEPLHDSSPIFRAEDAASS